MAITLRSIKGSELTFEELDENFQSIAPQTTSTGSLQLPAGDSSQRDGSPVNGYIRYNTGRGEVEAYIEGVWVGLATDVEQGELNQNAFAGIAVPGQGTIAADSTIDTLTIVGGTNIDITTTPATDTLTINNTFVQDFRYSQLTGAPTDVSTFTNDAGYLQDSEFTSEGLMRRGAGGNIYSVIPDNTSNWNLAYTWGDHSLAGYLTTVTMEDLTNVALTGVSNGQVLIYNNGSWVNSSPLKYSDFTLTVAPDFQNGYLFYDDNTGTFEYAAADLSAYLTSVAVDDLTDVSLSALSNNDILLWNGSAWANASIADAGGGLVYTDLNVVQNTAAGNGSLTYDNAGRFTYTPPDLSIFVTTEANDLTTNVTWANVPDAFITQSSVTQHQAALFVTESQITDLQNYLTAVPAEYLTQSEGDARYLQTVPAEFLTQTEGDARYLQTETTYSTSVVDSGEDVILRLTGSDASTDDITLVAGNNITLTPAASNITIDFAGTIDITNNTISTSDSSNIVLAQNVEFEQDIIALGQIRGQLEDGIEIGTNNVVLREKYFSGSSTRLNLYNACGYAAQQALQIVVRGGFLGDLKNSTNPWDLVIRSMNDRNRLILDTDSWFTDGSNYYFGVQGITQASPAVVTATNHGKSNGDEIYFEDPGDMVELTSSYYVSVIDADSFSLYTDSGLTTPLDSTTYTAFGTDTTYPMARGAGTNPITPSDALEWIKIGTNYQNGTPQNPTSQQPIVDYLQAIIDADYDTYKDVLLTWQPSGGAPEEVDQPLLEQTLGLGTWVGAGDPSLGNGSNKLRLTDGSRLNLKSPTVVPSSSVGSNGDLEGDFAIDASYVYYCTAAYDGVSDIWKRVALTGGSW